MFFTEIIKSKLICKQYDRPLEMVKYEHRTGIQSRSYMVKIVCFDPPCNRKIKTIHADLCIIFIFQPVLENFELKLSYCSDNNFVIFIFVNLYGAFLSKLGNTLLELFGFHGILRRRQGRTVQEERSEAVQKTEAPCE